MDAVIADTQHLEVLGASPFRVQAYSVTIDKPLVLNGGDVEIIARIVNFEGSGSIDVSGLDGLSKGIAPPAVGQFLPGNNGEKGNPGKAGGSIRIICEQLSGNVRLIASGGRGGDGQSGSDGLQGPGERTTATGRATRAAPALPLVPVDRVATAVREVALRFSP